jgi:catechol 2,3-dioxygenase-like lactoylglutathione lyase family enzyme
MTPTTRPGGSIILLWLWSTAALLHLANGFAPIQWTPLARRTESHSNSNSNSNSIPLMATTANEEDNKESADKHPMASTSRLSHVMLKVPSVDKTVKYWTDKGGSIRASRNKPGTSNGEAELMSAFVELGRQGGEGGKSDGQCFALELVSTNKKEEKYSVGNCISYIGVSMLLQFQNNLLGPITGEKAAPQGDEPNGIPIKSSASAPGDFLSRFSLQSRDLVGTHAFYSTILGMDAKGLDKDMVCLRYDMQDFPGVPTTLVFEATEGEINKGDCLDHLAILTKLDIEELHRRIQESEYSIFMNPTEMFGKQVMGVLDPNGYKVVIASE